MKYAQIRSGLKLHLAHEIDERFSARRSSRHDGVFVRQQVLDGAMLACEQAGGVWFASEQSGAVA